MTSTAFLEERRPRLADWLAEPMRRNRAVFVRVALAAAMINLFAYAISLFTLLVYDRVLPNLAFDTLTALSIGIGIILIFDFILRILRAYFVDVAGAGMDREIGAGTGVDLLAVGGDLELAYFDVVALLTGLGLR